MRTFTIGCSQYADIVIADESVERRHAEIVQTSDGRLHLTDCVGATHRLGSDGSWDALRQAFVDPADRVRLGRYEVTIEELVRPIAPPTGATDAQAAGNGDVTTGDGGGGRGPARPGPDGPVERDPETGEIIRKRP